MSLEEALARMGDVGHIGKALALFTKSLNGGRFVREKSVWVYSPLNFVALGLHQSPAPHLTLSLYGNWRDFDEDPELPIKAGRSYMWMRCNVDNARQLAAASAYIERACELHAKSSRQHWKYDACGQVQVAAPPV